MAYKQIDWSKHRVWSADMIRAERALLDGTEQGWGRAVEQEVKRRIDCAVATYAYEIEDNPLMSDAAWDALAQAINPKLGTCHPILDEFFFVHFTPMTGMWIHQHPDLPGIEKLYKARIKK